MSSMLRDKRSAIITHSALISMSSMINPQYSTPLVSLYPFKVEHNYLQLERLNPEEFKKKIIVIMLRKSIITTT